MKSYLSLPRLMNAMGALGILGTLALYSAPANACPAVKDSGLLDKVDRKLDILGQTIYFCKQPFNAESLHYKPTPNDLVTGGNQVISMGNAIQMSPIVNSIDLAGFSPTALNVNKLRTNLPINGGGYSEMSIFNFYSKVSTWNNSCDNYNFTNQFDRVRNYLRTNANIFQANNGAQQGIRSDVGDELAIIKDVPLVNSNQTNSPLLADITFYHNNAGKTGQYFTNGTTRMCWVGVSMKIDIHMTAGQGNNLQGSGDYRANVGVLTQ